MKITANQALERIMSQSGTMRKAKGKPLQLLDRVKTYKKDRLFIFGRDGSAVVAPADDTVQPILAEFDYDLGVINPTAQLILNDYAKEIKIIQEGGIDDTLVVPTAEPGEYVAPMFPEIMWHQHEPFNNNLEFVEYKPTKGLVEKCIVGCPATALSQMVYYFGKKGWRRGCTATPAYTSKAINGYRFYVTAEEARQSFDFDNILDIYTRKSTSSKFVNVVSFTEEQAKAAADLVAHVGKAMQTMYSPSGSGQQPDLIADAMQNKLHLGHVTIYKQSVAEGNDSTLYLDKVKEALAKGIPVVICGWNADNTGAHCFLAEGYRPTDDTYYINWGWGKGFNNGWFKMSLLSYIKKETSFNFSFLKAFLILDECPSYFMDVNRDGYINMGDVTQVISTMNKGENEPMHDVNYDGETNMGDAHAIIDKILGKSKV